MIHNY